jgi:hypothetical protein
MNRLFQGTPKLDDHHDANDDGEIVLDQYVLVEVAEEEDDDEIVVIHANDVAHLSERSSSPSERVDSKMLMMIKDVGVVAPAVGVVSENEVEDDCWNDMRYVMDVDGFGDVRSKLKAGTMILLLLSLLVFDAGDLYFLMRGRNSKVSTSHFALTTSKLKGGGSVERRLKYVPVAAPTESTEDLVAFPGVHLTTRRLPSEYDSIGRSLSVLDAKFHAVTTGVTLPMIPTVHRSASMMLSTNLGRTETPCVSIHPTKCTTDGASQPTVQRPPSSFVPMRSLIPYSTPRRVEKMNLIPSVREYDDWIPTNNWTVPSSADSDTSGPRVGKIILADHSPWSTYDASTTSTAQPQGSVDLSEYSFRNFIQHHDHVLVTFYFPCQRFETKFVPLWTNLTDSIAAEQLPVVTAMVDCDSHPHICREQGCYRFPTIRWFYKGTVLVEDYNRGRNAKKLLRFVKNTLDEINERNEHQYKPKQPQMTILEPVAAPKLLHEMGFNEQKDTNRRDTDQVHRQQRLEEKNMAFMVKQKRAIDTASYEIMAVSEFGYSF